MNKSIINMGAKLFSNAQNFKRFALPATIAAGAVAATALFSSCEKESEMQVNTNTVFQPAHNPYTPEQQATIDSLYNATQNQLDSLDIDTEQYKGTDEYEAKKDENQAKKDSILASFMEAVKNLVGW